MASLIERRKGRYGKLGIMFIEIWKFVRLTSLLFTMKCHQVVFWTNTSHSFLESQDNQSDSTELIPHLRLKETQSWIAKGQNRESITVHLSFYMCPFDDCAVRLSYPGDLTAVVLLHLQDAKVSIGRNYTFKSITIYLKFLTEIPQSPAEKSHTENEGKIPPGKAPIMETCFKMQPSDCRWPRDQGAAIELSGTLCCATSTWKLASEHRLRLRFCVSGGISAVETSLTSISKQTLFLFLLLFWQCPTSGETTKISLACQFSPYTIWTNTPKMIT